MELMGEWCGKIVAVKDKEISMVSPDKPDFQRKPHQRLGVLTFGLPDRITAESVIG